MMKISCNGAFLWRRFLGVAFAACMVSEFPAVKLSAADTEASATPDEFPAVTLVENSDPRYGAVNLDPWGKHILYFMFDGNSETGYNRMYAWVPGGREYSSPEPLRVDANNNFRTISWRSEKDDEIATTDYTFSSWRSTGTHGSRTSIDYITGETQVRSARPYTNINIRFTLDYMRDRSPRGDANLLQMRIPVPSRGHSISLSTNFAVVRPQAVWENVDFYWDVERRHVPDDQHRARLNISGQAQLGTHSHNRGITLVSVPAGFFDLDIRVAPYMKDPIFQETIPVYELVNEGLVVEVPYGWYTISYRSETHPWLGARELSRSSRLRPLGPRHPASAPLRDDDTSPASRLRGPPPSQLRGGR